MLFSDSCCGSGPGRCKCIAGYPQLDQEQTLATMSKNVQVRGYYRSNGTYVKPHTRSAPTKRSSSASTGVGSSSCSTTSSSSGIVHVSGYMRSNGTYVAPHTRSAPTKRSSNASTVVGSSSCSTNSSSSGIVHVSGYMRSNGTYVAPHTRSAPTKRSSNASTVVGSSSCSTTSSSSGIVHVSGYMRSNGTYVAPHTRSAPTKRSTSSSVSSSSTSFKTVNSPTDPVAPCTESKPQSKNVYSESQAYCSKGRKINKPSAKQSHASPLKPNFTKINTPECYADNAFNRKRGRVGTPLITAASNTKFYIDTAHNRRLGRVGKPIPTRYIRQREIIERNTEQEIILKLETLIINDTDHEITQSVIDRLHQETVEAMWGDKNVIPEASHLSTPGIQTIPYSDLDVKEEIGHGAFSIVSACLWKGKLVAYKRFIHQQMSSRARRDFVKEIDILISLDHPHTVRIFGAVLEEGNLGFAMEYMSRTLFQVIFNDMSEFDGVKKKTIVLQLARALEYLHTHKREIAHCDIKSQNVLLDHHDNAKLCDFGLSLIKSIAETSRSSTVRVSARGTPRYSAPEVLRGEFLGKQQLLKTDIYSLAVCVFEVVTEEEPFYGITLRQLEAQVGRGHLRPTSDVALSKEVSAFLKSCWDTSAERRPTATQFTERWNSITTLLA